MISFDLLFWVLIYSGLHMLPKVLPLAEGSFLLPAEAFFWAALFLHLRKKGLLTRYGLTRPSFSKLTSAFILVIIPAVQFVLFRITAGSAAETLMLLFSALAEETAFRILIPGLLQDALCCSVKMTALLSSAAFASFHALNIHAGLPPATVLLQILYAFCAGYAFFALVRSSGSLFSSVILHAAINLTSPADPAGSGPSVLLILLFSLILLIWGQYHLIAPESGSERIISCRKGV